MRYLCVPIRRYLIILPTGKMTPALADRESLVAFFFPPLADILSQGKHTVHCYEQKAITKIKNKTKRKTGLTEITIITSLFVWSLVLSIRYFGKYWFSIRFSYRDTSNRDVGGGAQSIGTSILWKSHETVFSFQCRYLIDTLICLTTLVVTILSVKNK